MLRSSCIWYMLSNKEGQDISTRNCVAWGRGRARHIPTRTDPTVGLLRNMSCSSCICVILPGRVRYDISTYNCVAWGI